MSDKEYNPESVFGNGYEYTPVSERGDEFSELYVTVTNQWLMAKKVGSNLESYYDALSSAIAERQVEADNAPSSEIREQNPSGFDHLEVENSVEGAVPAEFPLNAEDDDHKAEIVESNREFLRELIGRPAEVAPAPNEGETDESDDDPVSDDSDVLTDLSDIGPKTAPKIREQFENNPDLLVSVLDSIDRVESYEVDDSLEVTQRFDSLGEVFNASDVSLDDLTMDQKEAIDS